MAFGILVFSDGFFSYLKPTHNTGIVAKSVFASGSLFFEAEFS